MGDRMQTHAQERKPLFKTSFCEEYETLLLRCEAALENWTKRREEAGQLGVDGRTLAGEPPCLEADFAKSYAMLQRHVSECPLCEFVGKLASENEETPDEELSHQVRPDLHKQDIQ